MIEANAFLAAFAVQILVVSILCPTRFIRYVRGWAANYVSERFAQLYPGASYDLWVQRFVTRYRAVNFVIALLGLLLLGWLFTLTRHPDWAARASNSAVMYLFLQMSPMIALGLYAITRYPLLRKLTDDGRRTASLQRRGLLDFVSPFVVVVAVLSYLLFIPFALYVDLHVYQNAAPSRYCYIAIATVTLVYALNAFIVYKQLYGKKNPLVKHEHRVHSIGLSVRSSVYGSIAVVWFVSIMSFATKLELENWRPCAVSVFLVVTTLLSFSGVTPPPRRTQADELGPAPGS